MAKKANTTKKAKSKKNTYIGIIVDRSGSMSGLEEATIKGINAQISEIKRMAKNGGNTKTFIHQFDDSHDVVVDGAKAEELREWLAADFQPRGGTALYDAVWKMINVLKTQEETDDTGYLICVISDGEENSSKEVSESILSAEVKKLQDAGKWTFTYVLANTDIKKIQRTFHASANNAVAYNSTPAGTQASYTAGAQSIANYLTARSAGFTGSATFFSDEQIRIMSTTK